MFSGSFMVIAVLVVFASHGKAESSSLLVVSSSLTMTNATPASSATIGGLLSSAITTATSPPSATIGSLLSAAITARTPAATLSTGTLTLPLLSPSPSTTTTGPPSTTLTGPPSTTLTGPPSTTLTAPPSPSTMPPNPKQITCGNLSLVITKEWDESYLDWPSKFNKVIFSITEDIPNLFSDTKKYASSWLNILDLTKKDGYIGMTVKLCIEVKTDDADSSVIDVLNRLNKTGKLGNMKVKEGSVTFKEIGVDLKDWEVQNDGECSKCSKGAGGPFVIKRDCTSITQSCKGLKTKKSDECVKYCSACAAVAISSFTLIMGIILSFSFNIWK